MTPDFNYRAKVVRGGGYQRFDRARLCISVGQPYHEGAKLQAAITWAKERFGLVVVSVADTLQRHNGMGHAASLAAGDEWIARHADLLSGTTVQRWDDWLAHPDYKTARQQVEGLYISDAGFKSAVLDAARSFAVKRGTPLHDCLAYLLEETAVFAIQQRHEPAADIYPGSLTLWNMFIQGNVANAPDGLERRHYTRIGFVRA